MKSLLVPSSLLLAAMFASSAFAAETAPPAPTEKPAEKQGAPLPVVVEKPAAKPNKPILQMLLDDREVPDQAPQPILLQVAKELDARRVEVVFLTRATKKLSPAEQNAILRCESDGCLAAAASSGTLCRGRCDEVLVVRLTRHETAQFLALTRINALRPQQSDDAGVIVNDDKGAVAAVSGAVAELFPGLPTTKP